jgi:hypothetical protein
MSYNCYCNYFKKFKTKSGYYLACDILAFQSNWLQFDAYKNTISNALKKTQRRLSTNKITAADVCCGEYAWLPRHFLKECKVIYCVDTNSEALASPILKGNKNCILLNKDAAKKIFSDSTIDFLFCSQCVYERFIKYFAEAVKSKGTIFLMKPKDGDDFYLRKKIKQYDMQKRFTEIRNISNLLSENGFEIKFDIVSFDWKFSNPELDKILAAMSVVCFGEPELLSASNYTFAINFLKSKCIDDSLILSQKCCIWEAVKNG